MTITLHLGILLALAGADGADSPLPDRMSLAEAEVDPELPEVLPLLADPQVAPVWSSRLEVNVFAGGVVFEGDFESDPFASGGLMLRLPLFGRVGLFAEGLASKMDRDLEPPRQNMDGMFYGAAFGFDFSLVRNQSWYLMAQGGTIYLTFGDITGVDDGWGGVAGLVAGFHWIKRDPRYAITINPQWAYDGEDWLLFVHLGLNYRF